MQHPQLTHKQIGVTQDEGKTGILRNSWQKENQILLEPVVEAKCHFDRQWSPADTRT